MGLVKVWNENAYPFTQNFKGKSVTIQPKEFVQMDHEDAVEFRGAFSPIIKDKDGNPHPSSYKMIRIDSPKHEPLPVKPMGYVHPLSGEVFATKAELERRLEETKHMAIKDEVAEEEIKLASTETEPEAAKRGRGRPKKHGLDSSQG